MFQLQNVIVNQIYLIYKQTTKHRPTCEIHGLLGIISMAVLTQRQAGTKKFCVFFDLVASQHAYIKELLLS